MDIRIRTNQPNVYFDGGYVKLQYDTSVFSSYIAVNGNLDVSLCPEFQWKKVYLPMRERCRSASPVTMGVLQRWRL